MRSSLVTCLWDKRHHLCANTNTYNRYRPPKEGTKHESKVFLILCHFSMKYIFFVKGFRLKRRNKRCDGGDWAACYHFRTSLWTLFKITTCGQEAARPNKRLCSRMTFTENNEPRAQSLTSHYPRPLRAPVNCWCVHLLEITQTWMKHRILVIRS